MRKITKKFITLCLTSAVTVSTFGNLVMATETESDTAMAGIAVNFNNYYATSENAHEDILAYLAPVEETEVATEAQAVAAKVETTALIAEGAVAQNTGIVAVLGQLNIRKEPYKSAESIGYLYSNSQVTIYDSVSNEDGDWYLVEASGIEGYVSCDYVKTGEAAKLMEDNVSNKIATVIVEELEAKDSTTDNAQTVATLHYDEQYTVMEMQGEYVKLKTDSYAIGYVPLEGVKITTIIPEAVAAVNNLTAVQLEQYMSDIDYTKSIYLQRMAAGQYADAYYAAIYLVELWGYYIDEVTYAGMTDLAEEGKAEQEAAIALMNQTEPLAAEQIAATTPAETAAPVVETPASEAAPVETQPAAPVETVPAETTIEIVMPTAAPTVVGIEAFYQGAAKTEGEVISADELFIRADYSDGSSQYLYNGAGWYSPDVGMILSGSERVVTMYYDNYASSFVLPIQPAPTQPVPVETQPVAPIETQPATPAETQPAPTQPAETTAAPVIDTSRDYRAEVVNYAVSWAGRVNYVWAGANLVEGGQVDCSGFTMRVYEAVAGVSLPHYSGAQANYGAAISEAQLRPGDLVIYTGHVAIYIGNGQIVHAKSPAAGVVVDSLYFSASQPPIAFRSLLP